MSASVLVLGANGRLGQAAMAAFEAGGWQTAGQVRRAPARRGKARWIELPLEDSAALAQAAGRIDVVLHAVNPPYPQWQAQAMPLARQALELARRLDALLLFPGNVYNFGAGMPPLLTERTPQEPTARKGRIRVEIESMLREGARAGARCAILRAGDFFGGTGRGAWFDLIIAKSLPQAKVVYPGRLDLPHAWAYLPDLAHAFVLLAQARTRMAPFEVCHLAGHSPTGAQLIAAFTAWARARGILTPGGALQSKTMPWGVIKLGGAIVPMWRELAELRYLWDVPHRLGGERLRELGVEPPHTPLETAVAQALDALFPRPGA
jgi:nucleoside-diphosphate-sugar epimerase